MPLPRGLRALGAVEVPPGTSMVTCTSCGHDAPLIDTQRHQRFDRYDDDGVPVEVWYTCVYCRARLPGDVSTP